MKFINNNPYGLDHSKVAKRFTGELTYLGTLCLDNNDNSPWSWYTAWSPDVDAGHKDFMGLRVDSEGMVIIGRNYEEFVKYLNIACAVCPKCDEAIYSSYRHHMRYCSCHHTFVDGGSAYVRTNSEKLISYNLLSGQWK